MSKTTQGFKMNFTFIYFYIGANIIALIINIPTENVPKANQLWTTFKNHTILEFMGAFFFAPAYVGYIIVCLFNKQIESCFKSVKAVFNFSPYLAYQRYSRKQNSNKGSN